MFYSGLYLVNWGLLVYFCFQFCTWVFVTSSWCEPIIYSKEWISQVKLTYFMMFVRWLILWNMVCLGVQMVLTIKLSMIGYNLFDGQDSKLKSQLKDPKVRDIQSSNICIYDGFYHIICKLDWWEENEDARKTFKNEYWKNSKSAWWFLNFRKMIDLSIYHSLHSISYHNPEMYDFIEYFAYIFNFSTIIAGPAFEFRVRWLMRWMRW